MCGAQTSYCVGLLSAAALHGAADQQPTTIQILVDRAREPLTVGAYSVEFVQREREQAFISTPRETPTGTMVVATAEAPIFDLGEFADRCGGREPVVAVLEVLGRNVDVNVLLATARGYPAEIVEQSADMLDAAGHVELARSLRLPSADPMSGR